MNKIEEEFDKYNQVKCEMLKMSKNICCCDESLKELYQNICIEYTKELKNIKKSIKSIYGINLCITDHQN